MTSDLGNGEALEEIVPYLLNHGFHMFHCDFDRVFLFEGGMHHVIYEKIILTISFSTICGIIIMINIILGVTGIGLRIVLSMNVLRGWGLLMRVSAI